MTLPVPTALPVGRVRLAVIGGGITGLAAAHFAAAAGAAVTVFEQSAVVGGKLALGHVAGATVDVGAEAILARRPEGLELIEAAGLGSDRVDPLTTSAGIWTTRGVRPIPGGTSMGVPGDAAAARASGLFDDETVERIESEPQRPAALLTEDVSVGDFVAARLGEQVVDRLVDPLLGGVYAGRAHELSLRATMAPLANLLAGEPSLVKAVRAAAPARAGAGPVFAGLRGGIGRLPGVLAAAGTFDVLTRTSVRSLRRTPTGFALTVGAVPDQRELDFDAVIVATPAGKTAGLLRSVAPGAVAGLAAVRTASVAIVSLAMAVDPDAPLPAGSGLLVPASARSVVKGVTITSQKWPGAPAGLALVRASIGRIGEEVVLQRSDEELATRAVADLSVLLGTPIRPIDALVTRWGGALPQYDVGHLDRIGAVRAAVSQVPGLAVAGATYDGVGVPACIRSAREAVDRVLAPVAGADNGSHGR